MTIEASERGRRRGEGGGAGVRVRVSDSGIRQLVQPAWLEADLIVHLSLLQHPTCFCSTFCAFLNEDRHHSFGGFFSFKIETFHDLGPLLFLPVVLFFMYLPWHCCRDGGVPEELPLSAFCLQKEG